MYKPQEQKVSIHPFMGKIKFILNYILKLRIQNEQPKRQLEINKALNLKIMLQTLLKRKLPEFLHKRFKLQLLNVKYLL